MSSVRPGLLMRAKRDRHVDRDRRRPDAALGADEAVDLAQLRRAAVRRRRARPRRRRFPRSTVRPRPRSHRRASHRAAAPDRACWRRSRCRRPDAGGGTPRRTAGTAVPPRTSSTITSGHFADGSRPDVSGRRSARSSPAPPASEESLPAGDRATRRAETALSIETFHRTSWMILIRLAAPPGVAPARVRPDAAGNHALDLIAVASGDAHADHVHDRQVKLPLCLPLCLELRRVEHADDDVNRDRSRSACRHRGWSDRHGCPAALSTVSPMFFDDLAADDRLFVVGRRFDLVEVARADGLMRVARFQQRSACRCRRAYSRFQACWSE